MIFGKKFRRAEEEGSIAVPVGACGGVLEVQPEEVAYLFLYSDGCPPSDHTEDVARILVARRGLSSFLLASCVLGLICERVYSQATTATGFAYI
ncbi:hypothetical protein EVAR_17547_1 [Eumeta japonica]|uniref:PPM-type phosphatase domain-containing protein n=1 Tax=Eumeta variegata TaxID=151549 RepID=A0A4C1WQA0_EUMVA|nr:hypothetical protein EVAR_17547_1 [Eumeta japonica]